MHTPSEIRFVDKGMIRGVCVLPALEHCVCGIVFYADDAQ